MNTAEHKIENLRSIITMESFNNGNKRSRSKTQSERDANNSFRPDQSSLPEIIIEHAQFKCRSQSSWRLIHQRSN